ncbi:hypothetical protein FRB99_002544, partial [Tulasnella sp. 403]
LADLFCSSITNTPGTLFQGRNKTASRVEHLFCTVNDIILLLVEIKYNLGTPAERMNAIAQVVSEADDTYYALRHHITCDYRNASLHYHHPITCILFDGHSFQFFRFDYSQTIRVSQGVSDTKRTFALADSLELPKQLIDDIRPVCKIVFALLLQAHAYGLRSQAKRDSEERAGWIAGVEVAEEVLATRVRANGLTDKVEAEERVTLAINRLTSSIKALPSGALITNKRLMAFFDH